MAITAAQVKELRDRTGIAMMKCKKALTEADGDMEAAVEALRKAGLAAADKKADRETNNGGLGVATSDTKGALVMLACETDFVSGNQVFKDFVAQLADVALNSGATDIDSLAAAAFEGETVTAAISQKIAQLGENMQLLSVEIIEGEAIAAYNHGGRLAAVVAGSGDAAALRQVAMHIAAADPAPSGLSRDDLDQEMLAKERDIIAQSAEVQAKPEAIRPKIVEGKMGRFYKENALLEQEMLVDNDGNLSVEKWAAKKDSKVTGFAFKTVG
jgi:elongation factor Ts